MKFRSSLNRIPKLVSLGVILTFLSLVFWFGCQESPQQVDTPEQTESKLPIPLTEIRLCKQEASMESPYMQAAAIIQERYTDQIFAIDGVVALGLTLLEDGRIAFSINTEYPMTPETNPLLPKELEGIPVVYKVTGRITIGYPELAKEPEAKEPEAKASVYRPGNSISREEDCRYGKGTLGFIVRDTDSTIFII